MGEDRELKRVEWRCAVWGMKKEKVFERPEVDGHDGRLPIWQVVGVPQTISR